MPAIIQRDLVVICLHLYATPKHVHSYSHFQILWINGLKDVLFVCNRFSLNRVNINLKLFSSISFISPINQMLLVNISLDLLEKITNEITSDSAL